MTDDRSPIDMVEARHFTYASAHYHDPVPVDDRHQRGWKTRIERFVVLTPFIKVARPAARAHCVDKWGSEPVELNLYPRTYITDARAAVRDGRVVRVTG